MTGESRYRDQDLWMPKRFHDEYVQKLVGRSDHLAPFDRQVDLWWFALCVGVNIGERASLPARNDLTRFNDGGVLESDPWRVTHLELLVLTELGQDESSNPNAVVRVANEYAMTGFRELATELPRAADYQNFFISYGGQFGIAS